MFTSKSWRPWPSLFRFGGRRRPEPPGPTIYLPTRCGVCLRPVILTKAEGYHALLELDRAGMKVPHACDDDSLAIWEENNNAAVRLLGPIDRPGEMP